MACIRGSLVLSIVTLEQNGNWIVKKKHDAQIETLHWQWVKVKVVCVYVIPAKDRIGFYYYCMMWVKCESWCPVQAVFPASHPINTATGSSKPPCLGINWVKKKLMDGMHLNL